MTSLAFDFVAVQLWSHVPVEYPPARELAMRHYPHKIRPREDKDAPGILAPGRRFLLWHDSGAGDERHRYAAWGVVYNRFKGLWYFRNSLFRNESATLSSSLIREATKQSLLLFAARYKQLPAEPLITEVDIEETRARRGKQHPPGYCYLQAGWTHVRDVEPGHGRSAKAILQAP
jgi:hypothetical protein